MDMDAVNLTVESFVKQGEVRYKAISEAKRLDAEARERETRALFDKEVSEIRAAIYTHWPFLADLVILPEYKGSGYVESEWVRFRASADSPLKLLMVYVDKKDGVRQVVESGRYPALCAGEPQLDWNYEPMPNSDSDARFRSYFVRVALDGYARYTIAQFDLALFHCQRRMSDYLALVADAERKTAESIREAEQEVAREQEEALERARREAEESVTMADEGQVADVREHEAPRVSASGAALLLALDTYLTSREQDW